MSIREGLLALLAEGPKHGYQLKGEFESITAGVWPLNVGQVYTTLDRLERDGLVATDVGDTPTPTPAGPAPAADTRKAYRLTEHGRAELEDWFSAATTARTERDPLMIKVLVAMHTTGVNPLAVIDAQRAALLAALQQHRRAQRKALAATDELPTADEITADGLTAVLMFDALVARTESELRWLDLCEERLTSHGRIPR